MLLLAYTRKYRNDRAGISQRDNERRLTSNRPCCAPTPTAIAIAGDRFMEYLARLDDNRPERSAAPHDAPPAGSPIGQPLEDHLREVSRRCETAAGAFDSAAWGAVVGLWHDLGKYQEDFQKRLRGERIAVEHSGAGAAWALEKSRDGGMAAAFAIAAHHTGLANAAGAEPGDPKPLRERVEENRALVDALRAVFPAAIANVQVPPLPPFLRGMLEKGAAPRSRDAARLAFEFWVRFLFSCLVDADRLDAEKYGSPHQAALRKAGCPIAHLRAAMESHMQTLTQQTQINAPHSNLQHARASILDACQRNAESPPGFFSLQAPTGGGKTLAGMAFALKHADLHGLRRVMVVIPYTSIIEQNAKVYADIMGTENVLEHHSSLDPEKRLASAGHQGAKTLELAQENWDSPIIVTTTVQFFETLLTSKPSRCRKLHNVARSVIILDEVQTLPPGLLTPILDGLSQLVAHYGCSVVLSTATPPALTRRETLPDGLPPARSLLDDPDTLIQQLKRVDIEWPDPDAPALELDALAQTLAKQDQVLCVVHRRSDARTLARLLQEQVEAPVFHLSALMCPAHRLQIIDDIAQALAQGLPCRVVSTQLIEAGVDLDFPVVYRALGGLDSVIQAAGRCNREGRQKSGRVVVFRAPTDPPPGVPQKALNAMETLLRQKGRDLDAFDPAIGELYFRLLYAACELDQKNIQCERRNLNFATVGRRFRMIEDGFTHPIIIPWNQGKARLEGLHQALSVGAPTRQHLRALQPYVVQVYSHAYQKMREAGAVFTLAEGIDALADTHRDWYDERYGMVDGDEINRNNVLIF